MPTKNPRLTITLSPQLAAQLRRLSELTGNSQGGLISDLLEGSAPTFDRLITVLEAAEVAKDEFKGRAAADMLEAQEKLEAQFGLMLDHADRMTAPLLAEAEAIQRRARKTPGGGRARDARLPGATVPNARLTPISNRGVRSLASAGKAGSGRAK